MALQWKRLSVPGSLNCFHKAVVLQSALNEYDCRVGTAVKARLNADVLFRQEPDEDEEEDEEEDGRKKEDDDDDEDDDGYSE